MSRTLSRAKAKMVRKYSKPQQPKLRKAFTPKAWRNIASVMAAIKGCRGILAILSKRLGCVYSTTRRMLDRPDGRWPMVRQMFEDEKLLAADSIKGNLFDLALNCPIPGIRLDASKWLGERIVPEFNKSSRVTIEGGNPNST